MRLLPELSFSLAHTDDREVLHSKGMHDHISHNVSFAMDVKLLKRQNVAEMQGLKNIQYNSLKYAFIAVRNIYAYLRLLIYSICVSVNSHAFVFFLPFVCSLTFFLTREGSVV